jgi:hypothetical protein
VNPNTGKDLAWKCASISPRLFQLESPGGRPVFADGHQAAFESAFARLKKDLEAENSRR